MARNFSRAVAACVTEINNALDEGKVADLVGNCKLRKSETFTQRHAEECTDFRSLFEKLHHLEIIHCGNISFVEEILEDIGRKDLATKIKKANEKVEASQTNGGVHEEENQQQQRQGNGAQASQGAQNSNNVIIIGNNNKVMNNCVVNQHYQT